MQTPLARWLTVILAAILAVLGTVEVIRRPDVGAIALLGGAAIILVGLFAPLPGKYQVPVIMVGLVAGLVASLWTFVVPILAVVIVVLTLRGDVSTRS
jgi:hypothetical protein